MIVTFPSAVTSPGRINNNIDFNLPPGGMRTFVSDLMLHLKRISKDKRRKLTHLWKQYERIKPQVLGFIFDTLVQVLKNMNQVQLKELPRMADSAEIGEVISRCLGYPDNAFLDAYYKNIGLQTEQAIEASSVAIAVREFMNSKKSWRGTATELLTSWKRLQKI
jgi:hypothetical protein